MEHEPGRELGGAGLFAVEDIAEDGVADGGEVDAELVGAAGAGFEFEA